MDGRVLILGLTRTALPVARSLGRRGVRVSGVAERDGEIATFSKYCRQIAVADFHRAPRQILQTMASFARAEATPPVLMMTSDAAVDFVSRHRAELSEYKFLIPDTVSVEAILNKRSFYSRMAAAGFTIPATFCCSSPDEVRGVLDGVPLPCIIKPVYSHAYEGKHLGGTDGWPKVIRDIRSRTGVLEGATLMLRYTERVLIQDSIEGRDYEYNCCVTKSGTIAAESVHRYIWECSQDAGFLYELRMHDDRNVQKIGRQVVESVNYRGVCTVELRERDNRIYVIELNPRFGSVTALSTRCGVDFPWVNYCDLEDRVKSHASAGHSAGASFIDMEDTLNAICNAHRKTRFSLRMWCRTLANFGRIGLFRRKAFSTFAFDDLNPWARVMVRLGQRIVRRLLWRRRRVAIPDAAWEVAGSSPPTPSPKSIQTPSRRGRRMPSVHRRF